MTTTLKLVKPEPIIDAPSIAFAFDAQKEFHNKFNIPITKDTQKLYVTLVEEEHEEWIEAAYSISVPNYDELKELADLLYVVCGLAYQYGYTFSTLPIHKPEDYFTFSVSDLVAEIAIGNITKNVVGELIYSMYGYAHHEGYDLTEAYKRVHISNMSKLGDDGKPVYREDGKVMKGPNYQPPDLKDLV